MDVHTQEQYIFIHDAILEWVTCGDTQINASEFRAALHTLKSKTQSGETGFEHQFGVSCVPVEQPQAHGMHVHNVEHCPVLFQILEKVSPKPAEAKAVAAQNNHEKNRSMEFPPGISTVALTNYNSITCLCTLCPVDKWRVVLKGESPDYICASTVHVSFSCDYSYRDTYVYRPPGPS